MFKNRREPRLTPADIRSFGNQLEKDMAALLPGLGWRVSAGGPEHGQPEPDEAVVVFPLEHRGRPLGWISGALPHGSLLPPEVRQLLPGLITLALDKLRLRKARLTDRETGLFSRDYFNGALVRAIRKLSPSQGPKALSMYGGDQASLTLLLLEARPADGRADLSPDLAGLAAAVERVMAIRRPARVATCRIALILQGAPSGLRRKMEEALGAYRANHPRSRLAAAWAVWPDSLKNDSEAARAAPPEQAAALFEKATTALFYARQGHSPVAAVAFEDLMKHYGQVAQVLPLDRVVINLGRATGAAGGQVFLVEAPRVKPGAEPVYKGEITIFETDDSYSIGHITASCSSSRIVAGDRLSFSRLKREDESEFAAAWRPSSTCFLEALADPEEFIARLEPSDKPLALALIRLDGYDKTLSLLGREELDKRLNYIFEKSAAAFPKASVMARWGTHTMALAWPGASQSDIKPPALRLCEEMREAGPVSLGLVFSPNPASTPATLPDDAVKALNEASFSGHGQAAVFGPLSLNISGDHLFEGGDYSGALEEYERGLKLAPDHLNLLNSLGVCHGRLGNFTRALAAFDEILTRDPVNMMAHYNRGYTYLLAGRMTEAEETLSRAAELAPDNFETLFHLGKTALELGHLDRALPALTRAAGLSDSRPAVFRLLGEAKLLAHDNHGALAAFKKAVKAAPNDAYALSSLGALFVDLAGDFEVARSLFQKSVEIDPTNSLYRQRLGRLLFNMGDFSESERHLKMALEYGSRAPEVHYQLGRLAEELGRPDEAPRHFRAALKQDPAFAPALKKVTG